ncbi:granzyme B-like [Danio aesculapii]|uniref:granzyme B-like n=1 Tax=Danio aesculapii TaxID=1142201 RepID=UPI0024BF52E6|nr:granzyme B-like [Danio aesculapii]
MTMVIISLLLLVSLPPQLTFTAHVGIVNGNEATPHSRPYMVSVQYKGHHICGGFLINEAFVLTAAHCRTNITLYLTIMVGAHNLQNMSQGAKRIRVKSYYKHLDYYDRPRYVNDIMLLKVKNRQTGLIEKVTRSQTVSWISIPKENGGINKDAVCSVAGWGSLVFNGTPSPVLMETNVKIMNNANCEERLQSEFLPSQMMCVYGDGGSCSGDSGGPLVCGDTAVGVTSFVDTNICNSPEYPNVYTKISAFLQWINNIIKSDI